MQSRVFYSWQSDLPNATNRGFIHRALENAAKVIRSDDSLEIEPVIDRDTIGVPGAPDISRTILAKIDRAAVFVGDVSIVNQRVSSKPTPNPNVLIELGYALRALGPERIIMVLNTAFGTPESLPFDLRGRRMISYSRSIEDQEGATERRRLEGQLNTGLRAILGGSAVEQAVIVVPLAYQLDALHQVLPQMKEDGMARFSTRDLDRYISILTLRDGIKPQFEPLVSSSVMTAMEQLIREGRLRRADDGGFELV